MLWKQNNKVHCAFQIQMYYGLHYPYEQCIFSHLSFWSSRFDFAILSSQVTLAWCYVFKFLSICILLYIQSVEKYSDDELKIDFVK